jgi:pimeloyl-ACP methyl ester carboxylesterase
MPKQRVNDIDIYYEISGIHGLGSSVRDWELQVAHFSEYYQVVAFDVRGHGRSDKPPGPYGIPLFTSDTLELIRSLDISSAHIIGLSMGGMIAFQLAVSYPEVVKSMVITNSSPDMVFHDLKSWFRGAQRLLVSKVIGMRKMGEVLSKRLFIKPEQEELRQIVVERWAENDKRAYMDTMIGLVGWSIVDQLKDIHCPTLVIAADEDYTPVSYKESYAKMIKGAELVVINDSRHATPVEHPDEFNSTVMAFLSKQDE